MTRSHTAGNADAGSSRVLAQDADRALAGRLPPSGWPERLVEAFHESLAPRQHALGRFLLWVGLAVTIATVVVDFLVMPAHAPLMAGLRLLLVLPLQAAALAMPLEKLQLQKMLMGLSVVVFAAILLVGVQWAPPITGAYLAIGPVVLLGIASHVLPYSPREVGIMIVVFAVVAGAAILAADASVMMDPAYLGILAVTIVVSLVLPGRVWQSEAQNFLIALQSEDRLIELASTNKLLEDLSRKDPLTGLANRRHATEVFGRHYDIAPTTGEARVAVMMVDIDHFKSFNDRWGHQLGDDGLRAVAEELRHIAARNGGLAARFGGEEFVLFLRADNAVHAKRIADELRTAVERIEIPHEETGATATLTTSIGVALHTGSGSPDLSGLLGAADAALYEAKKNGRNRSELAA